MKKYLVSWIDRGTSHNGVFYAHNMKELREQTEYLAGHITSIDLLEDWFMSIRKHGEIYLDEEKKYYIGNLKMRHFK